MKRDVSCLISIQYCLDTSVCVLFQCIANSTVFSTPGLSALSNIDQCWPAAVNVQCPLAGDLWNPHDQASLEWSARHSLAVSFDGCNTQGSCHVI